MPMPANVGRTRERAVRKALTMPPPATQAALFTVTIFAGAVLLFWIQPLFTKMAVPLLGGSPLVWNTAMVFFQAMLLAGYAYAHGLSRWLGARGQLVVHAVVLGLAALALPIGVGEGWRPDTNTPPAAWLMALLFASLGAPFFALAATAPLLQRWFSLGRHPQARDPYFLYAASNAGSVVVLLAFPFVLEPLLATGSQSAAWSFGFAVLALGIVACGATLWRADSPAAWESFRPSRTSFAVPGPVETGASGASGPTAENRFGTDTRVRPPGLTPTGGASWRHRAAWLAYSAVPSALLLGVTAHISTDIASAPLLWVVPLALYLLSFVNAFARKPLIPGWLAARAMAFSTVLLAAVFLWREPAGIFLPLHLGAFFCIALACHAELARRRPPAARLTEFYLFLSLGGLVGGAFVALVAPQVFDSVLEYPLCLVLAAVLLPARGVGRGGRSAPGWRTGGAADEPAETNDGRGVGARWGVARAVERGDLVVAAAIAAAVLGATPLMDGLGLPFPRIAYAGLLALLAVLALSRQRRPLALALCIAALLLGSVRPPWADNTVWTGRSFFGVYRVTESAEPARRSLMHGTTNHGGQWMPDEGIAKPTTYYTASSPAIEVLEKIQERSNGLRVGVVGLGSGALAYYRRTGERWRYFEIDPLVEWLATESGYFELMPRDGLAVPVVLGDARLSLAREPYGRFDLLVLDAFNSDAIPAHLLTQEAVALYMSKLRPDGVLLFHISNRILDLEPVLASAVTELGYAARTGRLTQVDTSANPTASASHWVAMAGAATALDDLELGDNWQPLDLADQRRWRDDFSNLVGVIRWRGTLRNGNLP